jgi:hypothetical protein
LGTQRSKIATTIRKGNSQPIRNKTLLIAPIPGHVGQSKLELLERAGALKVAARVPQTSAIICLRLLTVAFEAPTVAGW